MRSNKLLMILCLVFCFTVFFYLNLGAKNLEENIDFENFNVGNFNVENLNISTGESNERIFVKIEGVEGESLVDGRIGWIEAISYSLDITSDCGAPGDAPSAGAGKINFGQVNILKPIDKTSPWMAFQAAIGEHLPEVIIDAKTARYQIKLQDAYIVSVSSSISKKEGVFELVKFNYGQIEWTYFPMNPDGSFGERISFSWDVYKNIPSSD